MKKRIIERFKNLHYCFKNREQLKRLFKEKNLFAMCLSEKERVKESIFYLLKDIKEKHYSNLTVYRKIGFNINPNIKRKFFLNDYKNSPLKEELKNQNFLNTEIPLLQIAVETNNIELAKALLENEVDLTITNPEGNSLLHIAAKYNLTEIGWLLLLHQANPNYLNKDAHSPLAYAVKYNNLEMASILLQSGTVSKRYAPRVGLVDVAVENNNIAMVDLLIQHGVSMNGNDDDILFKILETYQNPNRLEGIIDEIDQKLMDIIFCQKINNYSLKFDNFWPTSLKLDNFAEARLTKRYEFAKFSYLFSSNKFYYIDDDEFVIEGIELMNAEKKLSLYGNLPKIKGRTKDEVKFYCSFFFPNQGYSPLHTAVKKNLYDMANFLLESRCFVNPLDRKYKTPLDYAIEKKNRAMIRLLTRYGGLRSKPVKKWLP